MLINYSRGVLRPARIRLCCRCYVKQGIGNEDIPVQQSRDSRLMRFIDWSLGLRRSQLLTAATRIYDSCSQVDVAKFMEVCKMPDTFQSFFSIHLLHFWMCLVRLKQEGADGKQVIGMMNKMFWIDVGDRIDMMGHIGARVVIDNKKQLAQHFYGVILAYDEAILSHDIVLAAAIWKNVLISEEAKDNILALTLLVEYVRKQVSHLDNVSSHDLLEEGNITWLPLVTSDHKLNTFLIH